MHAEDAKGASVKPETLDSKEAADMMTCSMHEDVAVRGYSNLKVLSSFCKTMR